MSEVQKFIKKYAETNKKFYITEVIDRIKNQDMIWVAYSPITHNYHMDICEGKAISFIFSEKEYYNVYEEKLKSKGMTIVPAECKVADRTEPLDRLPAFQSLPGPKVCPVCSFR